MSPYLQEIAATYEEARDRLRALTEGMDDETFNAKPTPKGWSVGECVVHLNKIAKGYLPAMAVALTPDAPRGEGPFRYGWFTRLFIDSLRPGSRPIPTAPTMKPPVAQGLRSTIERERALERFEADIARYLALTEAADGYDLGRIRVASPFLPILRLPLGGFLDALAVHSVRHVMQAERAAAAVRAAG